MLLAVEGGGFFSSSASGYSKGLTVLFLGKKEETSMRVAPLNQYRLAREELNPELQLASGKIWIARWCIDCVCFSGSPKQLDPPPSQKVGPTHSHDRLKPSENNGKVLAASTAASFPLRSSLRMPSSRNPVNQEDALPHEQMAETGNVPNSATRRTVQWNDACGKDLALVREFEPSDVDESDAELDGNLEKSCSCAIM